MKLCKAKVIDISEQGEWEVVVFIAGLWRVFGTPYAVGKDRLKFFAEKKTAKRSAEKMAKAMGLILDWEVK
jgi:hypothetical protein